MRRIRVGLLRAFFDNMLKRIEPETVCPYIRQPVAGDVVHFARHGGIP